MLTKNELWKILNLKKNVQGNFSLLQNQSDSQAFVLDFLRHVRDASLRQGLNTITAAAFDRDSRLASKKREHESQPSPDVALVSNENSHAGLGIGDVENRTIRPPCYLGGVRRAWSEGERERGRGGEGGHKTVGKPNAVFLVVWPALRLHELNCAQDFLITNTHATLRHSCKDIKQE